MADDNPPLADCRDPQGERAKRQKAVGAAELTCLRLKPIAIRNPLTLAATTRAGPLQRRTEAQSRPRD